MTAHYCPGCNLRLQGHTFDRRLMARKGSADTDDGTGYLHRDAQWCPGCTTGSYKGVQCPWVNERGDRCAEVSWPPRPGRRNMYDALAAEVLHQGYGCTAHDTRSPEGCSGAFLYEYVLYCAQRGQWDEAGVLHEDHGMSHALYEVIEELSRGMLPDTDRWEVTRREGNGCPGLCRVPGCTESCGRGRDEHGEARYGSGRARGKRAVVCVACGDDSTENPAPFVQHGCGHWHCSSLACRSVQCCEITSGDVYRERYPGTSCLCPRHDGRREYLVGARRLYPGLYGVAQAFELAQAVMVLRAGGYLSREMSVDQQQTIPGLAWGSIVTMRRAHAEAEAAGLARLMWAAARRQVENGGAANAAWSGTIMWSSLTLGRFGACHGEDAVQGYLCAIVEGLGVRERTWEPVDCPMVARYLTGQEVRASVISGLGWANTVGVWLTVGNRTPGNHIGGRRLRPGERGPSNRRNPWHLVGRMPIMLGLYGAAHAAYHWQDMVDREITRLRDLGAIGPAQARIGGIWGEWDAKQHPTILSFLEARDVVAASVTARYARNCSFEGWADRAMLDYIAGRRGTWVNERFPRGHIQRYLAPGAAAHADTGRAGRPSRYVN